MVREARRLSETGIYHVIFRGVNRYDIFEEEKDFEKLLEMICDLRIILKFKIYGYCLMNNHVHLIIKEQNLGELSLIMQRLLTRYAGWYNRKYDRSGILIANRFSSEPVETDEYLLTLIRYVHQNPVKARLVKNIENYKWSSFNDYLGCSGITDTDFIFSLIDNESFIKYNYVDTDEVYEITSTQNKTDDLFVRNRIKEILGGLDSSKLGELPKEERNRIILYLRKHEGFSIRQIERATGISRGVISRCK